MNTQTNYIQIFDIHGTRIQHIRDTPVSKTNKTISGV